MEVIHLEKLVIQGGTKLHGEVTISGAKNAAVAIIPATLLINGVPQQHEGEHHKNQKHPSISAGDAV